MDTLGSDMTITHTVHTYVQQLCAFKLKHFFILSFMQQREPKPVSPLSSQIRLCGGLQWRGRGFAHVGKVLREDRTISDHLQRHPTPHQVRL